MYKTLNKRFFDEFAKPQKKKIIYGGAGSGKSVSIAQMICKKLIEGKGLRMLVLRKYFPSMRVSTYLVIKSILEDWGLDYKEQKTEHYIELNNNRIYFLSLDSPERIKGGEFNLIWMEETTEFNEEDYQQLTIRLARDKNSENVQMILSFNPVDQNHWCVKLINHALQHPDEYLVMHSTYKDNIKNLSKAFVAELKSYEFTDENFFRVYCKGEPGILENKIYNNFIIDDVNTWKWNILNNGIHVYGLDFGFNHPMCLCEVFYAEGEFYVRELFYKRECTTDDLAVWMQVNKVDHSCDIYADSAEPDRILALNTTRTCTSSITGKEITTKVNRFNIKEARKDVLAGIDYVKSQKIHLDSQSSNAIKEIQNYRFKKTRDGVVLEEPVKILDDFCDACRYALFSMKRDYLHIIPNDLSKGYSFGSSLSVKQFRL